MCAENFLQSTIVEIKERGLTERALSALFGSTIVEIKERGLTSCVYRLLSYLQ